MLTAAAQAAARVGWPAACRWELFWMRLRRLPSLWRSLRAAVGAAATAALVLLAGVVGPAAMGAEPAHPLADRPEVAVATLPWPPYTGVDLPYGGAVTMVVRAAFAQQGYRVRVAVWPWKRAIAKAKSGSEGMVAYFPGYHCHHDPQSDFLRSDAMGASPLGLAEHRGDPESWESLADLADKRVGTVVGYANTEAFDRRVAQGRQPVITAEDDAANLHKLLDRRIDYAVVDKYVLAYLKKTDPRLRRTPNAIRFDERRLEMKRLYICFRNDATGRRLRAVFNAGLAKLNAQAMLDRYIERMVKG
jgi:polar amino acid transport system substrate-binding protein